MVNKRYYLDERQRFVVENYNWAKPFSNFLPGIGGKWGIPMWVFYVSRAQCICSMGVRDKDHAILEFHSFNKALGAVSRESFRTFLKVGERIHEPFQRTRGRGIKQKMIVSSEELEISEVNPKLGLEISAVYYPLVNEQIPALVRKLSLRNLRDLELKLELIDGLPRILPYGLNQNLVKFIARHIESMMGVEWVDGVPLFRLKQTPEDIPQIGKLRGGNFYISKPQQANALQGLVVDPYVVFGESEIYDYPWFFERRSAGELLEVKQTQENKTPSAFTLLSATLGPREEMLLYSIVGFTPSEGKLLRLLPKLRHPDYLEQKRAKNREVIEEIKNCAFTVSGSPAFDQFCQQSFLDNVLRGGMPQIFRTPRGKRVFYIYSRKHGDLERDYHRIILEPNYLSQGDGFYRDVNQNRRSDVWFFPEVEEYNLVTFLNLIQLDGYNPQVVNRVTFTAENTPQLRRWLRSLVGERKESYGKLLAMVTRAFTPGEFLMELEELTGKRNVGEYPKIVGELLAFCRQNDVGDLHEGFWVDHWTHNLDLIQRFREIYPERLKELFLEKKVFTFFDNPDIVLPRHEKYVITKNGVRQYGAVVRDPEKLKLIQGRRVRPMQVRVKQGLGKIYRTTMLVKLLTILSNKIATLDTRGFGIMMEADKPGWCDSLNGLPGLLGSSICETLELERLCRFLLESLEEVSNDRPVMVFEELYGFVKGLERALSKRLRGKGEKVALEFWEESHRQKERYWESTRLGLSGKECKMSIKEIKNFIRLCLELLGLLLKPEHSREVFHPSGAPYTYFVNEVVEHEPILERGRQKLSRTGRPLVKAKRFRPRSLPVFLEGPMHMLRVHPELSRKLYEGVRRSPLYDRKLEMYANCEPLLNETFELGRIRAYAPGWIENGVYLHMEYKWLLEILRSGLHREFFQDLRQTFVPFLDPEVYGRSILEGGSFIVSSAFPDEKLHGRCFQPRLSGTTAEVVHIWTLMVVGEAPFRLNARGKLELAFRPILPGWLFTKEKRKCRFYDPAKGWMDLEVRENCFAFKFLGRTLVVYHNPSRGNTFGKKRVVPASYTLWYRDGRRARVRGEKLKEKFAREVRKGAIERIDVELS